MAGGEEGAAAPAPPPPAAAASDNDDKDKNENVLDWASRSTWRSSATRRRGDAEIEDEEGANGGGANGEHGGFDPHCPCCLATGGRLIDGGAGEPQNSVMPDGLEEAMLAKKAREAEVRASMAAARAERERRAAKEEEGGMKS